MSNSNSGEAKQQYIFPIKPSPYDSRDYIYEHRLVDTNANTRSKSKSNKSNIPTTLDLSQNLNYPRDQGKRGTCVAFACSTIKEYHERIDSNYYDYFSPNSLYFNRPNKPEDGMFLRDAMKILTAKGMAREILFPYTDYEPETMPNEAIIDAKNFTIRQYARVETIYGLKDALNKYGPCLISFQVYDVRPQFWNASSNDVETLGGHAVAVVGYNDQGFILRNSWGSKWNGDGTVIYPYDEWGKHMELWTCVDENSFWSQSNNSNNSNSTTSNIIKKLIPCLK